MAVRRVNVNVAGADSKQIGALAERGMAAAFSDAVRIETAEAVFLSISGQTPIDDDGHTVGATMAEQTRQVLERIRRIVEHAGGAMAHIVRVRVYVTDISPEALRQVHGVRNEYFPPEARPASTLVQISGIIRPGAMVEIDADAVIPR